VEAFKSFVRKIDGWLMWVSMVLLAVLMFLGAADVIGRYFFNSPILGAHEVSQVMLAFVILLSWAYVHSKKGHVKVDLIVDRLPRRVGNVVDLLDSILVLGVLGLMVWRGYVFAMQARIAAVMLDIVFIPIYPFLLVVSVGAFFMLLEVIVQIIELVTGVVGTA
jgi:TRAP-type C4-dicarboxylate transport system permease small subunit